MKKRDVILDFTSLLDVTLIVIFFFVIFSHLDSEENKAQTEAKIKEYDIAIEEAEEREAAANELIEQVNRELDVIRESAAREASNLEEMFEYAKSGNIKIILDVKDNGWVIRVNCKNEVIKEIASDSNVGTELKSALEMVGYKTNDTIFCDFVFDGSQPGTASAYRKISKAFDEAESEYKYLYYSETDLSVGEE